MSDNYLPLFLVILVILVVNWFIFVYWLSKLNKSFKGLNRLANENKDGYVEIKNDIFKLQSSVRSVSNDNSQLKNYIDRKVENLEPKKDSILILNTDSSDPIKDINSVKPLSSNGSSLHRGGTLSESSSRAKSKASSNRGLISSGGSVRSGGGGSGNVTHIHNNYNDNGMDLLTTALVFNALTDHHHHDDVHHGDELVVINNDPKPYNPNECTDYQAVPTYTDYSDYGDYSNYSDYSDYSNYSDYSDYSNYSDYSDYSDYSSSDY